MNSVHVNRCVHVDTSNAQLYVYGATAQLAYLPSKTYSQGWASAGSDFP